VDSDWVLSKNARLVVLEGTFAVMWFKVNLKLYQPR
jgi:hypothetical protein